MWNKSIFSLCFVIVAVLYPALCSLATATPPLQRPQGKIILTISGAIDRTNQEGRAAFDQQMLLSLPQVEIRTETPWTDGLTIFKGPRLKSVLQQVGSRGDSLFLSALNDYTVQIPAVDIENYPVILAMQRNGKRIGIRERGPLWVIYPWSENPELKSETFYSRSIWQLKSIQIK